MCSKEYLLSSSSSLFIFSNYFTYSITLFCLVFPPTSSSTEKSYVARMGFSYRPCCCWGCRGTTRLWQTWTEQTNCSHITIHFPICEESVQCTHLRQGPWIILPAPACTAHTCLWVWQFEAQSYEAPSGLKWNYITNYIVIVMTLIFLHLVIYSCWDVCRLRCVTACAHAAMQHCWTFIALCVYFVCGVRAPALLIIACTYVVGYRDDCVSLFRWTLYTLYGTHLM